MDIFDKLIHDFQSSSAWLEFSVLVACLLLAYGAMAGLHRRYGHLNDGKPSVWIGRHPLDGALFPVLALVLVFTSQEILARFSTVFWLRVAVSLLVSLSVIRFVARVLSRTFPNSTVVRLIERIFSWLAWGVAVLHSIGLLPQVMEELEGLQFNIGKTPVTLLNMIEGTLSAGLMMVAVLWLSTLFEQKVINQWVSDLGFGMQKIASNYVSGFLVLIERALRIGDNVRVDGFEGRITDIRTRYTVIRALNGRESIVPNETLITQRVENLTGFDVKFSLSTNIIVGMNSDVEQVRRILLDAAAAQPRVLKTPAPSVALVDFVEQGLQFSLSYYINDPQNGQGNVRSDVNLAVLRGLREAGVSLPVPKQVVQIAERPPQTPAATETR
jgi:small-conductance mechanosensitive channel